MKDIIYQELGESSSVMIKFIQSEACIKSVEDAAQIMISSLKHGGKIMSCGNGGSFSDAQHFASELSGKYRQARPALAAMALSDGGALTCIGNDFGFNQVFKRQLEAVGRSGDVLLALSTSGNSENVLVAAEYARRAGIMVVAITGQGGKLREHADVLIEIPHTEDAGKIQEVTIVVLHILVNLIERELCL
jgi:D-sedoheptulose 7-phosphate isomerase